MTYSEGSYKWVDRSAVTYTNWHSGKMFMYCMFFCMCENVMVSNDQEMDQIERNSHSKTSLI